MPLPMLPCMDKRLPALREIGWSLWDPIGLNNGNAPPTETIDEYDVYLLQAAAMSQDGASPETIADWLMTIEAEHMALGRQANALKRAARTAEAISKLFYPRRLP